MVPHLNLLAPTYIKNLWSVWWDSLPTMLRKLQRILTRWNHWLIIPFPNRLIYFFSLNLSSDIFENFNDLLKFSWLYCRRNWCFRYCTLSEADWIVPQGIRASRYDTLQSKQPLYLCNCKFRLVADQQAVSSVFNKLHSGRQWLFSYLIYQAASKSHVSIQRCSVRC